MASELTQSTTDEDSAEAESEPLITAIRWVFPLPVPPASWLEKSLVTLGRDASCDVTLEGGRVSRCHAELSRSGSLWIINDLESKNGLFVNGRRVRSAALGPGDVLRIGDHVGVITRTLRSADLRFGLLGPGIYGGVQYRAAVAQLREIAVTDLPVVIEGATGTGKEQFARALHEWSERPGRFLAVNCAVYSKSVASAELFGYRKGAFTGAEQASSGHVRAAQEGTLLLDELIELPLDVQAMLLRVIQNREVLPLGETRPIPVAVRFAAATQIPLAKAVEQERFRADLRARIEGRVIRLPALGACRETVPEFFCALYEQYTGGVRAELTPEFAEGLCLYGWPLNVRELETLARRLSVSHKGQKLGVGVLSEITDFAPSTASAAPPDGRPASTPARASVPAPGRRPSVSPYRAEELQALLAALARHEGNLTRVAAELGLTRQKAYRMLEAAKKAGLVS